MNITRMTGLLIAALVVLLVPACSSATDVPVVGNSDGAGSVSAEHNDADVAFVQGMVPHHSQAVEMAQLATDRAAAPQVTDLAVTIEQAQGPEIALMRAFLDAWGVEQDEPADGMNSGRVGMMTDAQLQQLEQTSGPEFDRMFLQMMTAHHTGAVQMAETELREGRNAQAKTLARQIIDNQRAEIAQMQNLLTTL